MKSKSRKKNKSSGRIFVLYILIILFIIFLALPLLFQDKAIKTSSGNISQKALPLKTENPFTRYFNLFKEFYGPNKHKKQNEFSKIKGNLQEKNTQEGKEATIHNVPEDFSEISADQTATARSNYYADDNSETQNNIQRTLPQAQNTEEYFVKQEPFVDFLMEGLYETSQLDPYETKQLTRQKISNILSPNTIAILPSAKQIKQPIYNGTSAIITQGNYPEETQIILFNDGTNTNRVSASAHNYLNKVFNPFRNNNAIADKLNINNLPFETQANLVTDKLYTVYADNLTYSGDNNSSSDSQDNPGPKPPLPPLPPQNTFDPTKWDQQIDVACSAPDQVAVQADINQLKSAQQETEEENPDKIEHCDHELQDKLPKVNNNMQRNYNYLLVSGRYNGKIMIPAYNSLSDTILTFGIQSEDFNFLNYPEQLQGKKFSENTKATSFKFVVDLNPQIFNQMMQDEKTILISVDPQDQKRYPQKTILIESGEIETFSGVTRIVDEINNFKQKQEQLKKAAQEQEKLEKEQKTQDLKNKINSVI